MGELGGKLQGWRADGAFTASQREPLSSHFISAQENLANCFVIINKFVKDTSVDVEIF